ncbi:MAG: hypothetical protein F6K09_14075 [Merismopedia sp. SIO2A8]|nr:hypothetical protein [Merismopedia sp. SIO2A8]
MDKLARYRQAIKATLTNYHQLNEKVESATESCLVVDDVHDHYLLLLIGWNKDERIKSVMIHLRLKNAKIWTC